LEDVMGILDLVRISAREHEVDDDDDIEDEDDLDDDEQLDDDDDDE